MLLLTVILIKTTLFVINSLRSAGKHEGFVQYVVHSVQLINSILQLPARFDWHVVYCIVYPSCNLSISVSSDAMYGTHNKVKYVNERNQIQISL